MKKVISVFLASVFIIAAMLTGTVVAAEPAEGDVLYENDFKDGLPADFRIVNGDASRVYVKDGFLYLNADGLEFVRVLLPEALDSYGNYEITVSATLTNPRDAARWNSIVYRVQNGNYPYYQMCVRSNATAANGVEFALRNASAQWNVTSTGSNSEAIDPNKLYTYTVKVCGDTATHSINGNEIIFTEGASEYQKGGIGLQANFSVMKVDSIKVTYLKGVTPTEKPQFVEFAQPDTGIIGGYTFSEVISNQAELDKVTSASVKPANAIFYINSELKVTDKAFANPTINLSDAIKALDEKIMPTVYIGDSATASALVEYLKSSGIEDIFVMSADGELVKSVRTSYTICRGIIDFTAAYKDKQTVTTAELDSIRAKVNSSYATIAVIPSSIATSTNVKYLYDRVLCVWVNAITPITTVTQAFGILSSGGSGAITDNTSMMYDVTRNYMSGDILLRSPLNVGHRGIPVKAPENTIEGSVLGFEAGADTIELDIYITTDGEIVVMHDGTTGRTFNKNLTVESCTLAQLKELTCNTTNSKFKACKVPTLREYYDEFKGKDVLLFVEIKSTKAEIITKFAELTKECGMENQVNVITFHDGQLKRLKNIYPEMSGGFLCGWIASGSEGAKMEQALLKTIQRIPSTFNPSYGGYNADFAINANMRGTLTWPWTVDDKNVYIDLFMKGYNGLTTNNPALPAKWTKTISTTAVDSEALVGSSLTINASKTLYNRTSADISSSVRVIILEGKELVTVDGTTLKFGENEGTVSYALEYTNKINTDNSYNLYTSPVTVTVKSPAPVTTAAPVTQAPGTEAPKQTDAQTKDITEPAKNNKALYIIIAVIALVVIVAVVFIILKKKK